MTTTPTAVEVEPEAVSPWETAAPPAPRLGRSLPLSIAVAASAGAGLVHASAAGSHNDHRGLAIAFCVIAVLQLAWAALVWQRGATPIMVLAGGVHIGALGMWLVSRTVGVSWFPGLEDVERVGLQDATAVVLQVIALAAVLAALLLPGRGDGAVAVGRPAVAIGAVVLLGAVPGMVTPHPHDTGDDAGHAASHVAATREAATREATTQAVATQEDDGLPDVAGVTPAQRKRAAKLIEDTEKSLVRFPTVAAAEAAGYRSIGDAITGFEHFVNAAYLLSPEVLNPLAPESLVFKVGPDGTRTLASAMYILPPGKTMADVPDVAGTMTQWHDHQNLCWDASGTRLAGILVNGRCTPGGTFRPTPPMLHVWVVEHECGPFAGIEGTAHSGSCLHGH